MKRILQTIFGLLAITLVHSQGTYYWVGGTTTSSFTLNSNWNTALDGSGTTRLAVSTGDVLIIDGSNIGGAIPSIGAVTATVTSTGFSQLKLINNAVVFLNRAGGGTGTLTVNGGLDDDLVVETGSTLNLTNPTADGTVILLLPAAATGKVDGSVAIANGGHRFVVQATGALIFSNGSSCTVNATNYPFGTSTNTPASIEKGVVFQSGSHLYYNGGNSPIGNNSTFSSVELRSGSNYHMRASNGTGSFVNNRMFGNLFVENNATLTSDGAIYKIENLTINSGCGLVTHSSGHTAVTGNIIVNGTLTAAGTSTNTLVLGGSSPQTVSGSGSITVPSLLVADNADVSLGMVMTVNTSINIYGKINFNNYQLGGNATFSSRVAQTATSLTGNAVAGSYQITGVTGIAGVAGLTVTGTGIPANTSIISFSTGSALITLSQPVSASGTGITLNFSSDAATLATSHSNGMDPVGGSVIVAGNRTFESGINYIINAATSAPFGVSTGSTTPYIRAGYVEINAPVVANSGVRISDHLALNGKLSLRPLDTVRMLAGAAITGSFGSSNYIVTTSNNTTGEESVLQFDSPVSPQLLPIGTANYYLPATITQTTPETIAASVFEGITTNGQITGTAFTPSQKQTVVNAVWRINNNSAATSYDLQLQWPGTLEGSTFTTLPATDIGIIANNGSLWGGPIGTADNTTNTANANYSKFGSFSLGAVPQTAPFIFNALPAKTYGDADFNGGATSLNTIQPVIYSSDNIAVATIVNGDIHITGAGTATITASQASDGFYPPASLTQTLTVAKAALTVTAADKTKYEGEALPILTATYTGLVNGETPAVLLTPALLSTTATVASPVGTYPITVTGATAANYTISFVNGVLTVQAKQTQTITFNALPVKVYGNANFVAGASSTNTTIPVTYTSSNTNVATIIGGNIHIVGAGTVNITASQAGNAGFFPATDVVRALTINKAALAIRVRDTTKIKGQNNPTFTITYTGFVLGETVANLTTPPSIATAAGTGSPAGYYTLTPEGAVTGNYNITYTSGRLTILPITGTSQAHINAFMPNSTTLTVRVYSTYPALADIGIFDMNGRLVMKKNVLLPEGFMNFNFPVTALPSGIYIIKAMGSGVELEMQVPIIK